MIRYWRVYQDLKRELKRFSPTSFQNATHSHSRHNSQTNFLLTQNCRPLLSVQDFTNMLEWEVWNQESLRKPFVTLINCSRHVNGSSEESPNVHVEFLCSHHLTAYINYSKWPPLEEDTEQQSDVRVPGVWLVLSWKISLMSSSFWSKPVFMYQQGTYV